MPKLPIGDMGPCEVVWGYGESGAMYLGEFLGGVKLGMETTVHDIKEDGEGEAAVDAVFGGSVMTLDIPLTRSTYEQLAAVLLSGDVITSGDHEYIKIKNPSGCSIYDLAEAIVIKPICGDVVSDDPAEWLLLHKCYPVPGMDLTFDPSTQRVFPIKFKVFVCQESPYIGDFGMIGMPSGSDEYGSGFYA